MAQESKVPVINALSAKYHPTQILADLMTLHEHIHHRQQGKKDQYTAHTQHPSETLPGLKVAWVGDANNILQEMLVSFPKLGIHLSAATPQGYHCDQDVVALAKTDSERTLAKLEFTTQPQQAIKDADVVVTDTWISMGQEEEKAKRLRDFAGYQVTMEMVERAGAKPDWSFMHCLPRKSEEVDDQVKKLQGECAVKVSRLTLFFSPLFFSGWAEYSIHRSSIPIDHLCSQKQKTESGLSWR